jgi:hypothetical protein
VELWVVERRGRRRVCSVGYPAGILQMYISMSSDVASVGETDCEREREIDVGVKRRCDLSISYNVKRSR